MVLRGKGPTLVGVLWFETLLCMFVLALRIYTRTVIRHSIGWDDLLLIVSWALMVAFSGLCTASAHHGMGVHASEIAVEETPQGMLLLLIGQSVISISMGLSKCAVAAFLMRIVVKRWHKIFLWFWNITIMALSILLAITVFAQCTPVQSIWDSRVPSNGCSLNLTIMATIMCAWSAVLDFVLALFPWVALWNLNMKKKEKYTICLSLSLGIFAGICGVIRTTGLDALTQSTDYLYATTDSVIWTMSELTTTIICVSIPALRPLYRSIRGNNSSNDASYYNNIPPYRKGSGGRSGERSAEPTFAMDTITTTTVNAKDIDDESGASGRNEDHGEDTDTRHILQHPHPQSPGIYQVNEVRVSYEDRRPGGGMAGDNMPSIPVKAKQHI
ncbi:hypothetical protein N7517_000185 [Penicillium concentricum]|uniref:Rhodopsin domain-containing protein n=1 Tax=Penicillium concentricum TaxID=293559 RepID=A0A9W9SR18_9EURO|nr:uncharacterized protein N7517_000185 [Penicillium concentricum]KAJ5382274.1 hypothetical protein N7517_000185 [Penicillium concentricum]